jgi:hypothetical protein
MVTSSADTDDTIFEKKNARSVPWDEFGAWLAKYVA